MSDNNNNALTSLMEDKIELIKEEILESIEELEIIEENQEIPESKLILEKVSLWSKVKYGLSKLGRYKAGGKIFGKRKIDQETAAKITRILDKKGNENKKIRWSYQKTKFRRKRRFPKQPRPRNIFKYYRRHRTVYDSLVETKKDPSDKGFLPIDVFNTIILDLREYVKKFLDVDLSAFYSVMDSEEESENELIVDSDNEEDRSKDVEKITI